MVYVSNYTYTQQNLLIQDENGPVSDPKEQPQYDPMIDIQESS